MRKRITILGILCSMCLLAAPISMAISAGATNSDLSSDRFEDNWWEDASKEDIEWNTNDLYEMETVLDVMPKSFEAWLQLDANVVASAGAIFSNVDANVRINGSGGYRSKTTNALSLEIDAKGHPKLYHKDDSGEVCTVVFGNVDVRSGEFVHLAVTRDETTAYCYLNGVLADSAELSVNDFVSAYSFAIGGDYQETRTNYFKGKISSIAVYSDSRSQQEIAASMSKMDTLDEDLIAYYKLSGRKGANVVDDKSKYDNDLNRTWLFSETIDEPEYEYSFMALGDTQALNYYRQSQQGVNSFDKLYDYIVANAKEQKVAHVFHLGDITQKSGTSSVAPDEFNFAKANYEKLDEAGISYSVLAGNHDFSNMVAKNYITAFGGEDNSYAKQYFSSPDSTTALCTAHKFSAGNLDYLVLSLSCYASDADLAWADALIQSHPYHNVIIATHVYMNVRGEVVTTESYNAPKIDALAKRHANVVLTLNGHTPGAQVETFVAYGENGNKITQMVIDPTYFDGEHATATVPHFSQGAGMIAYLRFSEGGSKVSVSWYSAVKEKYYNSKSVYTVDIATIARRVPEQLSVKVNGQGGTATASQTDLTGEPIQVTFTPEANYYLSKVTLNGENITSSVVNNVYTLTNVTESSVIVAEFALTKYPITLVNEEKKGSVIFLTDASKFAPGTEVTFSVTAKSGWKISEVSFNGTVLTASADGTYAVVITDTENSLSLAYEQVVVQGVIVEVQPPVIEVPKKSFFEQILAFFQSIFAQIAALFGGA